MTKVEEALAQMEDMLEKPPHVLTAAEIAREWEHGEDRARLLELRILRHMEHHIAVEREACAKIADEHKGAAAKRRLARGMRLGSLPHDAQDEIVAEERGEDIASEMIAKAIRARGK